MEATVTPPQSSSSSSGGGGGGVLAAAAVDWRRQYHHCKHLCSTLLLITGHGEAAFTLSCDHAYCPGLMAAWDRDPASLGPRLVDVLRRKGAADEGTDDDDAPPLLIACLHWLEDRNRLSEVLSIGLANKGLLELFLQVGGAHEVIVIQCLVVSE